MPLIHLSFSKDIDLTKADALIPTISKIIADCTGKPEQYVMVMLDICEMMMSGQRGKSAFATIKSVGGLSLDINEKISLNLAELIETKLDVPKNRIYLNFINIERENWGYNGKTFKR